jgi:hypothetical protein
MPVIRISPRLITGWRLISRPSPSAIRRRSRRSIAAARLRRRAIGVP